jgi:hypothetical protein
VAEAQYQLGELLPAAIGCLRKLFGTAKDAANPWSEKELVTELIARELAFSKLATASFAKQWQVNTAIHYNSWDNLEKPDFEPVVKAFKDLLGGFACSECGGFLRVFPEREKASSVRCECNKVNLNLTRK